MPDQPTDRDRQTGHEQSIDHTEPTDRDRQTGHDDGEPPQITSPIDGRGHDGPLVRPFGCHPDVPIVRRIGDRPLFLGNRFAADPVRCDRRFDAVFTVAEESEPGTTHHRPLVDGPEAEWQRFRTAVDTARRLYRGCTDGGVDRTLLVHCKAGISRSNTAIATTIACEEDRRLLDAFDLVRAARPHAVAHPRLHELAVYYVSACGDRDPPTDASAVSE